MELSLSIASFPVDEQTENDMERLMAEFAADWSLLLHAHVWRADNARGFAVLAYTEEHELLGFASAADIVGLHQYEWSAIVHPAYQRHSIGTALAEGVAYALKQRRAEGELAAFIDSAEAPAFLESLGYEPDFEEIQLGAAPLEQYGLPGDLAVTRYAGEQAELEALLETEFGKEALFNIEEGKRDIRLLKRAGQIVATAALISEGDDLWVTAFAAGPAEQEKGFGRELLEWCRHFAYSSGKGRVLLDVETENGAVEFYERAGFFPVSAVAYWKKG